MKYQANHRDLHDCVIGLIKLHILIFLTHQCAFTSYTKRLQTTRANILDVINEIKDYNFTFIYTTSPCVYYYTDCCFWC